MLALPHGAADSAWMARVPPVFTIGCPGRYGARCAATPIGPMPGPPPPCGMLNVLCRLMWHTSAPIAAGLVGAGSLLGTFVYLANRPDVGNATPCTQGAFYVPCCRIQDNVPC